MSIKATVEERNALIILTLVNSISGLFTIMGNALVIAAILKTPSLNTPSFKLITCLCFSDLAVGLICHPLFILIIVSITTLKIKLYCTVHLFSVIPTMFFFLVSILTITAISVDRCLALRLQMQYKMIVTDRRAKVLVVFIWAIAIGLTACGSLFFKSFLAKTVVAFCVLSCVIATIASYIKCFRILKTHCARVKPSNKVQSHNKDPSPNAPFDVTKYKGILITMLLVLCLFLICYVQLFGVLIKTYVFGTSYGITVQMLTFFSLTFSAFNSALNPFIYMIRMRDIRKACFQLLKKSFYQDISLANISHKNDTAKNPAGQS
jgi:hypothetical protein